MKNWSKWVRFERDKIESLEKTLNGNAGVYSLRVVKDGNPKPLNRIGKIDKYGILYYGKTNNLFVRLTDCGGRFDKHKGYAHSGAVTYIKYFSETNWFEDGLIQVRWKFCKNEKVAKKEEKDLIKNYRKRFMDSPPLNSNG
jgi:hypothetical protein